MSTSNVCSWLTDFAGIAGRRPASGSMPARPIAQAPRRACRTAVRAHRPAAPRGRRSCARRSSRSDVRRPLARRPTAARSAAAPGTPPPSPGGTTTRPSGLRRSRRRSWRRASSSPTPTDAVSPSSSRIAVLDQPRDRLAVAEQLPRAGDVEERLVDRDRLDERREPPEDRHDLAADAAWYFAPSTGRKTPCGQSRRAVRSGIARVDAELARLVARRADDARDRSVRRRRRSPACRAAPAGRAARPPRRTRRGRRGGSSRGVVSPGMAHRCPAAALDRRACTPCAQRRRSSSVVAPTRPSRVGSSSRCAMDVGTGPRGATGDRAVRRSSRGHRMHGAPVRRRTSASPWARRRP